MEKKNMLVIVAQHLRGSDLARATENILSIGQEENDGGPGSGNFGHSGRKGKRGGSSKRGTGSGGRSDAKRTRTEEFAFLRKKKAKRKHRQKFPEPRERKIIVINSIKQKLKCG